MAHQVEVRKVEDARDFRAFFEFPWTLYRDDPNWVPPLLSIRRELLDKSKNPAWEYMEGDYFAAWRGDQIVGTITAFINHRHNQFHDEHVGWFGTFETINDPEVATALLDTATEWVRSRGYDAIRGPQSFTTHEECGLLIDNFSPPVILMPYNPTYYQTLVEGAGFSKAMDVVSIYADADTVIKAGSLERMEKIVERLQKRNNFRLRPMNMRDKAREFERFKEIYNAAWEKNWGFVPMTERELDVLVDSLGMLVDPNLAHFAEIDGEPAGFVLSIPDFNEVLQRVYPRPGVPEFWSLLRIGWLWKVRRVIKGARTPLLGVKQEYRDRGIDLALHLATLKGIMNSPYKAVDSGWILETNELISIATSLGGEVYKTHRFYEKRLR